MHTDRTALAPHHGPIPDGRDSLRLVRLRLALTLVIVAVLPVAAVTPTMRAITDDSRVAQHERLLTDADHAATDISNELEGIRVALADLADHADILGALEPGAQPTAIEHARLNLAGLIGRPANTVTSAFVTALGGEGVVAVGQRVDILPTGVPPIGIPGYRIIEAQTPAGASLEMAFAAAPAGGAAMGVLRVQVSLDRLLAWATPPNPLEGRSVDLEDAVGIRLAHIGGEESAALPDRVLNLAAEIGRGTGGSAAVAVSGLPAWHVVTDAPLTLNEVGLPAIAAFVGLIGVLILFTIWMGRQILRPAAQLEAQRAHLHELYETAREAALLDSLTGLGNHRAFQENVARMVEATRGYATPFALILLDIDEFKRVNDTRGHAVGDELLSEFGELIRASVRGGDGGYRIGGDEFAILLPHADAAGAEILARRLLRRGLETRSGGIYSGQISFSAGITSCPELGASRLELTAQADAALYRGKRGGRTVVSIFDPSLDRGHVDEGMRAELSSAITGVIESGALSPVYQPIVHLPTGRVLGFEALVRVAAEATFPNTGAMFDAAEIAGRVLDLDRAALDVVLRGAAAIPDPLLLSVNVSPRSFEAPEFNATVFLAILNRHGIAPGRVILELTEREVIRDPERLGKAITALQAAGVRVAADDVGAGNAGLRLLSQFRFDVVKIDLSLVQGGAGQEQTLSVLTSLAQLAKRWGALTIAEGVETPAQLTTIRQLGIDSGQGYLLGRPGTSVDLEWVDLDALEAGGAERAGQGRHPGSGPGAGPTSGLGVVPVAHPTIRAVPGARVESR